MIKHVNSPDHHHHHHSGSCNHDHHDEQDASAIILHEPEEFAGMREAGKLAAQTLDYISPYVKAGVTTEDINRLCHEFMIGHQAIPAPLGYGGSAKVMPFPKSVCTSVNHVVCHGIPGDKKLIEGDILNIDVTVIVNGWHGDSSRMYKVGKCGVLASKLIDVTYEAMMRGIEVVQPGASLGDIGHAIQTYAEKNGFSVVRDFCGHGVGRAFHALPNILHFGKPSVGMELKKGMFFTIEPMINAGRPDVKILSDGWTAVTRDKSLSAQFEHSVGVTENGYEIFTLSGE
jgi:methionyl aminopeptidase